MSKKENNVLTPEQLEVLNGSYPVADDSSRVSLPRFGMLAKDIIKEEGTGKNKKIEVIEAAGTFYTEKDEGEVNEEGKKVWTKKYIGEKADVIITFHRKQLRFYDKGLNKYISSPIYDDKEQIIPLFLDKRVIARGTPAELQSRYPKLSAKGKPSSNLNEETILYVIYNGELHQCNLSQSSKWSFLDYRRKLNPSTVVTELGSVEETNGINTYRKMTFKSKGLIDPEVAEVVINTQAELKAQVASDAQYFLEQANEKSEGEDTFDKDVKEITDGKTPEKW
jgi:hypothetical protein